MTTQTPEQLAKADFLIKRALNNLAMLEDVVKEMGCFDGDIRNAVERAPGAVRTIGYLLKLPDFPGAKA